MPNAAPTRRTAQRRSRTCRARHRRRAVRTPLAAAPRRPAARARYGDGAVIACDGLVRIYKQAELEVVALQGLDLLVDGGEMIAIVGASGSGKSTLLNILGGMDVPSAGPRGRRRLRPRPARQRRADALPAPRRSGSCGSRPGATCCRT